MSQPCVQCTRPATLFGCNRCVDELRDMLTALPGWITALAEEANGETRKGTSVRRSTDKGSPALCRLGKDGSFRGSPGQQQVYTHSVLVEWVRDLCETRGVTYAPQSVPFDFIGPLLPKWQRLSSSMAGTEELARWLTRHVSAIASDQGFAVCYREIKGIIADIERLVDLPPSARNYGACPTIISDSRGESICDTEIVVPPGVKTVKCRGCGTTFTVAELIALRLSDPFALYTAQQVLVLMESEHVNEPIPERTWRRWRAMKRVIPAGELYGEPAYRIDHVRAMRRKWTRAKAG